MSSRIITPGISNISGVISPLITFDCIFDTDFGLLKLIRNEYFDKKVFSFDFFFQNDKTKDMITSLYLRSEKNPLSLCINSEYKKEADNLYEEFMKDKYDKIVEYSMPTEIYNLIEALNLSGESNPTILYSRKEELSILNSHNVTKNTQKISINEITDVEPFNQFYFKDIDNQYLDYLAKYIRSDSVYFGYYNYNMEDGNIKVNKNVSILSINRNSIYLIDIYNKQKLGVV